MQSYILTYRLRKRAPLIAPGSHLGGWSGVMGAFISAFLTTRKTRVLMLLLTTNMFAEETDCDDTTQNGGHDVNYSSWRYDYNN